MKKSEPACASSPFAGTRIVITEDQVVNISFHSRTSCKVNILSVYARRGRIMTVRSEE